MTTPHFPAGSLLLKSLEALGENTDIYLYAKDTDGRYIYANHHVLQAYKCSRDQLIGSNDEPFLSADGLDRVRADDRQVLEHGATIEVEETIEIGPDRKVHTFRTRKAPIRDEDGKIVGLCGLSTDITDRRILEETVAERSQLLDTVLNHVDTHIYIKDQDGRFLYANSHVANNFHLPVESIVGHTGHDFMSKADADHFKELDDRVFASGVQQVGEEHYVDPTGKARYFRSAKIPMKRSGQADVLIGFSTEITEARDLRALLQRETMTDHLTGLPNRLSFHQQVNRALQMATAKGQQLAVLVIGLDRFKNINDTLGHNAGDLILVETAARLTAAAREHGNVFRLGGDQFALALPSSNTPTAAAAFARTILDSLAKPHLVNGKQLFLTASLGISMAPTDGTTLETLLKKSETAMFHAKTHGRNAYHFFSEAMEAVVMARMEVERDLHLALANNELELHFQPIIDAQSGAVALLEALVRWNRPQHGLVSPAEFIAVAEEIGIIEDIGDWVINEACRHLAAWQGKGHTHLRVSVNLSAKQLQSPELASRFLPILARHRIVPAMVELEITESLVMSDPDLQIGQLQVLRAHGFSIAIDDFGTGYSSLAYIQRLPVSTLKIDRAFVQNIEDDPSHSALCRGIIALAHSLDLTTIAEGIETEAQAKFLSSWGCDYLQGYRISRPMKVNHVPAFLDSVPAELQG